MGLYFSSEFHGTCAYLCLIMYPIILKLFTYLSSPLDYSRLKDGAKGTQNISDGGEWYIEDQGSGLNFLSEAAMVWASFLISRCLLSHWLTYL